MEQSNEKLHIDLSTESWTQKLAEAPIYAKKVLVRAEQVTELTEVVTQLADGTIETTNTAQPGDYIVTNPGGERYVLGAQKFESRNSPTDEPGVYRAKGMARAVQNNTGQAISITAPWGEEQFGSPDCMIATVYDPEKPDEVSSDRYIIGRQEFLDTYDPADVIPSSDV